MIAPAPAVKREESFAWYSASEGLMWPPYAIAMYPSTPPHKMVRTTTAQKIKRNCLFIAQLLASLSKVPSSLCFCDPFTHDFATLWKIFQSVKRQLCQTRNLVG